MKKIFLIIEDLGSGKTTDAQMIAKGNTQTIMHCGVGKEQSRELHIRLK